MPVYDEMLRPDAPEVSPDVPDPGPVGSARILAILDTLATRLTQLEGHVRLLEVAAASQQLALGAVKPLLDRIAEMSPPSVSPSPHRHTVVAGRTAIGSAGGGGGGDRDPSWVPVLHQMASSSSAVPLLAPNVCGGVAFYLTRRVLRTERAQLELMRVRHLPDPRWVTPSPSDVPRCSTCGVPIDPYRSVDLDFTWAHQDEPGRSADVEPRGSGPGSLGVQASGSLRPSIFPAHTSDALDDDLARLREISEGLRRGPIPPP